MTILTAAYVLLTAVYVLISFFMLRAIKRQADLTEKLQGCSLAVVNANDILPTRADGVLPMQPNPEELEGA